MKTGCLAVFTVLALLASPLTAGLIVFEEFDSAPPSPPWTSATSAGYSIIYGGEAVFAGSGNGSARLTYSVPVAGDFLAGAVVIPGWNLAHGGALGLAAFWEDSNFFDIYLRNIQGNNELAAYNSRTGQNPWQPWSGEATLLLVRSGNSIYAGAMSDVPSINGTPDLSGFLPLASWTGDQYLGPLTLQLFLMQDQGTPGAQTGSYDVFALAVPPYYPDVYPPDFLEGVIPEPGAMSLVGIGLLGLMVGGYRRRDHRSAG